MVLLVLLLLTLKNFAHLVARTMGAHLDIGFTPAGEGGSFFDSFFLQFHEGDDESLLFVQLDEYPFDNFPGFASPVNHFVVAIGAVGMRSAGDSSTRISFSRRLRFFRRKS